MQTCGKAARYTASALHVYRTPRPRGAEREGRLRASLLGWAALAASSCARRDAKAELLEHQAEVALLQRALATRALRVALAEGRGARFGLRATLHAWAAATRKPPPRAPSHVTDDPDRAYA